MPHQTENHSPKPYKMKKLSIFIIAVISLSSSAFAFRSTEPTVSAAVQAAFQKGFATATEVSWEQKEGLYFARFVFNDVKTEAAYLENGELIAASKQITRTQLPLAVTVALNEKFDGYEIAKNVTEVSYENSTAYYLQISNGKQLIKLKVSAYGDITIESKLRIS